MGNRIVCRVLVLGIDGAGKTSFVNKIEDPDSSTPTTPTDAYKVRDIKFKGVKFNVWDVSGKKSTRSLWKHYYREGGTDAIIYVVDSSDRERIKEAKQCLSSAMMDPAIANVLLFVLANKQDEDGALTPDEVEEALSLNNYRNQRQVVIHGISALTGDGIREVKNILAEKIKEHIKEREDND